MKIIKNFLFILIILFFIHTLIFAADKVEIAILSFPQEITVGQEFEVEFTVKKINPLFDSFYYKGRIGNTDFSQGETYNILSDRWLGDSSAWSNYFSSILNENGVATLTAKLRTKTTIATGSANLQMRINLNGINYDSPIQTIIVNQAEPTPTITTLPYLTPTNSLSPTSIPVQPTPTDSTDSTDLTTPNQIPTNNVYISEIMVYPETSDHEWIEFYNNNDFPVTLKDWYIDDLENGGSSPKKISLDIQAKNYAVYDLSFSMFNNNGDQVRLLNTDKNVIDSFEYALAEKNISWARIDFDTDQFCLQATTKNQANNDNCINDNIDSITTTVASVTNTPTPQKILTKKTATIAANFKKITPSISSKNYSNIYSSVTNTQVLGEADSRIFTNNIKENPLKKSLSFLSTAFPFLTIVSLFFKMKKYAA